MKTAVVYYSLDGNCALVAQEIKSQLNADLLQLKTMDEKKRGKFGKILWGCAMVFSNKKPLLKPYSFDPTPYDLIVIGVPVWASSPAPPVKTFLGETKIIGKKIALFVCHAGGKGDSLEKFKTLLESNEIAAVADFKEPSKLGDEELKSKIAEWVATNINIGKA